MSLLEPVSRASRNADKNATHSNIDSSEFLTEFTVALARQQGLFPAITAAKAALPIRWNHDVLPSFHPNET